MTRRDLSRLVRFMSVGMAIILPWTEGHEAYEIARHVRGYPKYKHLRFTMTRVWSTPAKVTIRRTA
jgi:hypothetical protein